MEFSDLRITLSLLAGFSFIFMVLFLLSRYARKDAQKQAKQNFEDNQNNENKNSESSKK